MFYFPRNKPRYTSVEVDDDYDNLLKFGDPSQSPASNIIIRLNLWSLLLIIILFLTSIISSWVLFFNIKHFPQQDTRLVVSARPSLFCQQAPIRREWRTLTTGEQQNYVRAVRCLATKPSKLNENGTLYDDFPWVHKHTSSKSTSDFSLHQALIFM